MMRNTGSEFVRDLKSRLRKQLLQEIPKEIYERGSIDVAHHLLCDQEHALAVMVEEYDFLTLDWIISKLIQMGHSGDAWFVDGNVGVHMGIENPNPPPYDEA